MRRARGPRYSERDRPRAGGAAPQRGRAARRLGGGRTRGLGRSAVRAGPQRRRTRLGAHRRRRARGSRRDAAQGGHRLRAGGGDRCGRRHPARLRPAPAPGRQSVRDRALRDAEDPGAAVDHVVPGIRRHAGGRLRDHPWRVPDSGAGHGCGARRGCHARHRRAGVRRAPLAALLEGRAARHRADRARRHAAGGRVLPARGARGGDVRRPSRHGVRAVLARQRLSGPRAVCRHRAGVGGVHRHRAIARRIERSPLAMARRSAMKLEITDVRVHRLSIPLPRPVRTARHDHSHVDTVAVEMRTDAGPVGIGYCFAFGARRARALAALVEDLAEIYVGRPPAPQARHAEAWRALNFIGHAGLSLMALTPLDTACWDLAARAANLPLFRFLGGDRTRVPPYDDLAGCARVAAALDMRIATGETDYGSAGMKRHLEARAADVLMPDLQRMGGPTEFLRAAALCNAWQQPVSSHLFTETSAHLLAATPNALILEHMGWWEPLFTEPPTIEAGCVVLSEKPGLGVELSQAALKRYTV